MLKGRLRVEASETGLRELGERVVVRMRQEGCCWRTVSGEREASEVRALRSVKAAGEARRMASGCPDIVDITEFQE